MEPGWLYATHVERSETLIAKALELARRGAAVDIDTVEEDLARWLRWYVDHDGPMDRLTVSSDAGISSPRVLSEQLRGCVTEHGFALEHVLPLATSNPARILNLRWKGTVDAGKEADLLVLDRASLETIHVLSRGRWMVRARALVARSRALRDSPREVHLVGEKR